MINYCDIVDKALGDEMSQHRTLRTRLDPGSSELDKTTMEEKISPPLLVFVQQKWWRSNHQQQHR